MTIADYRSLAYFPLTTQQGLTFEQQIELDARNFDDYAKALEAGERLSDHERAVGRELEAKHAARANLLRSYKAAQAEAPQGLDGAPLGLGAGGG